MSKVEKWNGSHPNPWPASWGLLLAASQANRGVRNRTVTMLATSDRDLIVLSPRFDLDDLSEESLWTREELDTIRAGKPDRRIIVHLPAAATGPGGPIWKDEFLHDARQRPSWLVDSVDDDVDLHTLNGTLPDAVAMSYASTPAEARARAESYPSSSTLSSLYSSSRYAYPARFWNADYQAAYLTNLDSLLKSGFDGVFLTGLTAYILFEPEHGGPKKNLQTGLTFQQDMMEWVSKIASHGVTSLRSVSLANAASAGVFGDGLSDDDSDKDDGDDENMTVEAIRARHRIKQRGRGIEDDNAYEVDPKSGNRTKKKDNDGDDNVKDTKSVLEKVKAKLPKRIFTLFGVNCMHLSTYSVFASAVTGTVEEGLFLRADGTSDPEYVIESRLRSFSTLRTSNKPVLAVEYSPLQSSRTIAMEHAARAGLGPLLFTDPEHTSLGIMANDLRAAVEYAERRAKEMEEEAKRNEEEEKQRAADLAERRRREHLKSEPGSKTESVEAKNKVDADDASGKNGKPTVTIHYLSTSTSTSAPSPSPSPSSPTTTSSSVPPVTSAGSDVHLIDSTISVNEDAGLGDDEASSSSTSTSSSTQAAVAGKLRSSPLSPAELESKYEQPIPGHLPSNITLPTPPNPALLSTISPTKVQIKALFERLRITLAARQFHTLAHALMAGPVTPMVRKHQKIDLQGMNRNVKLYHAVVCVMDVCSN